MNENLIINSNVWRANSTDPKDYIFKLFKDKIEIKLRSKKD